MAVYKVVAGPTHVHGNGAKAIGQAATAYATLINAEASAGWQFICFDSSVVHRTDLGCSTSTVTIKLLVFAKDG